MFASPALKAVICISQMVRDDVRRHFALPDDKLHVIYNAVDPREFSPAVRAASRRDARGARPRRRPTCVPAGRLGLRAQGRGDGDPRARAAARRRAPHRRRPRQVARRATGGSRSAPAWRDRVIFAGPQHDPAPVPRRRRCVRAAHALRSAVERGAGSARLRPAGRDQHALRRRRAGRRARRRLDLRRHRRCRLSPSACGRCSILRERARRRARARSTAVAALTPENMTRRMLDLYATLLGQTRARWAIIGPLPLPPTRTVPAAAYCTMAFEQAPSRDDPHVRHHRLSSPTIRAPAPRCPR